MFWVALWFMRNGAGAGRCMIVLALAGISNNCTHAHLRLDEWMLDGHVYEDGH